MSDAQVQQVLVKFFTEIDNVYTAAGAPPHGQPEADMLQWTIDLESEQLKIVDNYLAANAFPAEVKQHLTDMKDGLTERIDIYQSWIDNAQTRDSAPASEGSAADAAAEQSTYAETQLRIKAGV